MARNKTAQGGISLRRKVTAWLAAILLVTMLSTGIATMAGQWTVRSFDTLLADNAVCYTVQNALKDETQAFARYVRQPTSETEQAYTAACAAAEQSLAALPFDYVRIGEERYARTWNLLQGYAGYRQERDAFLQLSPSADTYIEQMYRVMALQDYLAEYALRLTQATLEQENALYSSTAAHIRHLPWLYLGLFLTAAALMLLLIRVLSRAVVRPLLRLAQASRSIAEGDLSSPDLPVKSSDEVGRLTGTFNQMKHAMAQQLTTQQALHREEVRNLALEKDLEHTRLEVLKSQVNPHFLFNTLNMISCMARLEDASTTDQMIVHLGNLFRHNLRTKRQQITLEEELDGLEDYIYLQQMRFDGRITVEKSIRVQPAAVLVPSFMLQPVVENAYSHGLKSCEEGGRILLRAWMQDKVLVLTVTDNGKGMNKEELDAVQSEMIRHNTRRQIYLFAAIGSALNAKQDVTVSLTELKERMRTTIKLDFEVERMEPLFATEDDYQAFHDRQSAYRVKTGDLSTYKGKCFLGIDAGSTTTKTALVSEDGTLLYSFYSSNNGNPLKTTIRSIKEIYELLPKDAKIAYSCSTVKLRKQLVTAIALAPIIHQQIPTSTQMMHRQTTLRQMISSRMRCR